MIYPGGKPIPKNVFNALKLTGKIGFISKKLWNKYFAVGEARWSRRQFQNLIEMKLLAPHPNKVANNYFVLTPLARQLLHSQNCIHVGPTHMVQICHDEFVADSILKLEGSGLIGEWQSEAELKHIKEFQLNENVRDQKYPDAILNVTVFGSERTVVLEYERTQKSSLRYKDILWLYSLKNDFCLVIFICAGAAIEKTIMGRMKYLAITELYNRIAFAQAEDWKLDPVNTPIRYGGKVITLNQICQRQNKVA